MIMYDYDSGYINAIPMKSRKSNELLRAFELGYAELTEAGLTGQLLRLDNEISKDLRKAIKDKNLQYQLASPGDHRQNLAERAIQTWKAYFISIRSGVDPSFPDNCWDLLIALSVLTLNLLRGSKINPRISAYTQVKGAFNWNATPLMPPGCKVIVHDRHMERNAWDNHGTPGFYINITPQHYRNHQCYMPTTIKTRISNTVEFLPAYGNLPTITPLDRFTMAIEDVVEAQRDPYFLKLAAEAGTPENIASRTIRSAWECPRSPTRNLFRFPCQPQRVTPGQDPKPSQSQSASTNQEPSFGRTLERCGMKVK